LLRGETFRFEFGAARLLGRVVLAHADPLSATTSLHRLDRPGFADHQQQPTNQLFRQTATGDQVMAARETPSIEVHALRPGAQDLRECRMPQ